MADAEAVPDRADVLVGRCEAIQEVYKAIGRVAATDATVLILGESGTGKELVARAVYQHSTRADKPFLAINCGAIPENLIESELFGHEKGAFTGAERRRIGKFEQCNGGTIFLDEIGDMPLLAQVKLLRVLQEQQFERVGGNETVRTDVRVIAATNADLEQRVATGRFRQDLYFRLNVFSVRLCPCAIAVMTSNSSPIITSRYSRENSAGGPGRPARDPAALRAYRWPGNVRELQSVLKQAVLQTSGAVLLPESLSVGESRAAALPSSPTAISPVPSSGDRPALDWERYLAERMNSDSNELYAECLSLMERQLLTRVLQRTGGNQLRAAERLGITRSSLRHKLRALGITVERAVWSEDSTAD